MALAGDCPGKGTYSCLTCGVKVVVEKDEDKLPVCPKCGGAMYRKC